MSRAYRPRLSKDKAVAQRLQDLSIARQLAAEGVLDTDTACTPSLSSAAEAANVIEATPRLRDASVGLSSTPGPTPGPLKEDGSSSSSRSRSRNSNRDNTPTPVGKQKGSRARAAAETTATAPSSKAASSTAVSPASSLTKGGGRNRRSSSGRKQRDDVPAGSKQGGGGSGGGSGSGSRKGEWACVSCSFLNVVTAKKCRICSTKNYQARLSQPTASAPAPAPASSPTVTAASKGVAGGVGGSRGSVAQGEARCPAVSYYLSSFRCSDFSVRRQ